MYIKTQKVGERTIVHERSYYDLTLATSDDDGSYLIALVRVEDNLTPLKKRVASQISQCNEPTQVIHSKNSSSSCAAEYTK